MNVSFRGLDNVSADVSKTTIGSTIYNVDAHVDKKDLSKFNKLVQKHPEYADGFGDDNISISYVPEENILFINEGVVQKNEKDTLKFVKDFLNKAFKITSKGIKEKEESLTATNFEENFYDVIDELDNLRKTKCVSRKINEGINRNFDNLA
jgi:hypothetical protein